VVDDEAARTKATSSWPPTRSRPRPSTSWRATAGPDLHAAHRRAHGDTRHPAHGCGEHLRAGHGVPLFDRCEGKITTGISAADRAVTIKTAVDPARAGRHLDARTRLPAAGSHRWRVRAGRHTEARSTGAPGRLDARGVICEIMNEDGTMARRPQLEAFAAEHGLKMITVADLIRYRRRNERLVVRETQVKLPTRFGEFTGYGYRSFVDDRTHMALVVGDVAGKENVLVRGPLGVPHRRCLPLAALRLRRTAGRSDARVQEEGEASSSISWGTRDAASGSATN